MLENVLQDGVAQSQPIIVHVIEDGQLVLIAVRIVVVIIVIAVVVEEIVVVFDIIVIVVQVILRLQHCVPFVETVPQLLVFVGQRFADERKLSA